MTVASFDFTPAVSSAVFIDVISFPAALTVAPGPASVFKSAVVFPSPAAHFPSL